jgi:hypothetical protein
VKKNIFIFIILLWAVIAILPADEPRDKKEKDPATTKPPRPSCIMR